MILDEIDDMVLQAEIAQYNAFGFKVPQRIEISPETYYQLRKESSIGDMLMKGFNPERETIRGYPYDIINLPDGLRIRIVKVLHQRS